MSTLIRHQRARGVDNMHIEIRLNAVLGECGGSHGNDLQEGRHVHFMESIWNQWERMRTRCEMSKSPA
jgi:hypothetical protein